MLGSLLWDDYTYSKPAQLPNFYCQKIIYQLNNNQAQLRETLGQVVAKAEAHSHTIKIPQSHQTFRYL